jgi:hypothetical protein
MKEENLMFEYLVQKISRIILSIVPEGSNIAFFYLSNYTKIRIPWNYLKLEVEIFQ